MTKTKPRPNVLQAKAAAIVFGLNPPNRLHYDVLYRKMLRKLAQAGLHDVHPWWRCAKQKTPCPMHNPSDHHMRTWPWLVRHDKEHLTERVCKHGVGHPDPDSLAWAAERGADIEWLSRHGCECRCCNGGAA